MSTEGTTPTAGWLLPDWAGEIGRAMQAQDLTTAFALAEQAVAAGAAHPLPYRLHGAERDRQGRSAEAVVLYQHALTFAPQDAATLNALGLSLAKIGQTERAAATLERAAHLSPEFAPIRFNLGWVLEQQGRLNAAEAAYGQAVALDAGHAPAMANLAVLRARRSRWALAREHAHAALAISPQLPAAHLALAMSDLGEGRLDAAAARLQAMIAAPSLPLHERSVALNLLAETLDRSGDAPAAFSAYLAANQGFCELFGSAAPDATPGGLALVRRIQAQLDDPSLVIRASSAPTVRQPVFLLSFPRSATTLTGQILAAHPGVLVSDEQELLTDAGLAFLAPANGLSQLAAADDVTLERFRALYWNRVRQTGLDVSGKLFVDKLPMNTLALPLIARLFPEAKIIFMVRDPRDVVWSCFRQRFIASGVARDFTDLDQTAALYDAVMRLAHTCIVKLELKVHFQSYERLVSQFDTEVAALCAFLNLEPCAEMADFAAGVGDRDVATPSAAQIARGLNADSIDQWRRYAGPMAAVLPRLAPWVDAFGYASP